MAAAAFVGDIVTGLVELLVDPTWEMAVVLVKFDTPALIVEAPEAVIKLFTANVAALT